MLGIQLHTCCIWRVVDSCADSKNSRHIHVMWENVDSPLTKEVPMGRVSCTTNLGCRCFFHMRFQDEEVGEEVGEVEGMGEEMAEVGGMGEEAVDLSYHEVKCRHPRGV